MKKFVVRFLMKNSNHFLDVVGSDAEARSIMERWKELTKNPGQASSQVHLGGYDQESHRNWTVRVDDVAAAFTIDVEFEEAQARKREEAQRQQQQRPAQPPYYQGGYQGGN